MRITLRQIVLIVTVSAVLSAVVTVLATHFLTENDTISDSVTSLEPVAIADPTVATDEQNNIDIYRAVSPGVVNITTRAEIQTFFGAYPQQGSGSGSIIDVNGRRVILTNYHVVADVATRRRGVDASIEVSLFDKSSYPATVLGIDPDHDLAVLSIEAPPSKLQPVAVGESSNLLVGQKVLAIGNPFGLEQTLTTGIISALERPLGSPSGQQIAGVIQTDAAINPGNSGGPLLNSRGEMIGINTAIFSETGGNVGIGFAVPIDVAKRVVPELIANGRIARAYLGIGYRPITPQIARALELPRNAAGLLITQVQPGSPAAEAGLTSIRQRGNGYELGDVLVSADGRRLESDRDLSIVLNQKRPGETVRLEVLRGGRTIPLAVVLDEAPVELRRRRQ